MAFPIIPIAAGVGLLTILALSKGGKPRPIQVFGENQNVYRVYTLDQLDQVMVLENERRTTSLSLPGSQDSTVTLASPGDFTSTAAEGAHLEAERLANEDASLFVVEFANNILDVYAKRVGLNLGADLQGFKGLSGNARLAAGYALVAPSLTLLIGDQALATVTNDPLVSVQQVANLVSAGA